MTIRTRLLTVLLPLVALAMVAALLIATTTARHALDREAKQNLAAAAEHMADALDELIEDAKADTLTTAHLDLTAQALDSDDPKNFNWYADELVRGKAKYTAIAVIDTKGRVVGSSTTKPLSGSVAQAPYFAALASIPRNTVTTLTRHDISDAVIGFAAPVYDITDERLGTLLVFCAPAYFRDRIGAGGSFVLEDASGTIVDARQAHVAYVERSADVVSAGWKVTALQTADSLNAPINAMTLFISGAGALALVVASIVTSLLTSRAVAREAMLEAKLAERTAALVDILGAVDQALFTVGKDGTIDPEYSAAATRIFGTDRIAGEPASDFLQFAAAYNDGDTRMQAWLANIVGADDLQWTLTSEDPTLHIRYCKPKSVVPDTFIDLSYRPIFKNGLVDRVMIAATDVTRLRDVEAELRAREEESRLTIERLNEVVSVDPQLFTTFLTEARNLTNGASAKLAANDVGALLRDMHTLKGNARIFRLTTIQNAAHAIEDTLQNLATGDGDTGKLVAQIAELGQLITAFEQLALRVIGAQTLAVDTSTVQVREARVLALRRAFQAVGDRSSSEMKALGDAIAQLSTVSIRTTLDRARREVADVARTLGKRVNDLVVTTDDIELDARVASKLSAVLMHLLRNAVDHGIELERGAKPSAGTVSVTCRRNADIIHIEVQDDGQGIDLSRVRAVAESRNLASASSRDDELMELLFTPGFTTAKAVNAISGRGVGLDVVRTAVRELGGVVQVRSRAGEGTTVHIAVPLGTYEVR